MFLNDASVCLEGNFVFYLHFCEKGRIFAT